MWGKMAKSQGKTKVAVLRATIGISAKEFADLVGKTVHTVNSLESGRLVLSDKLAIKIGDVTSVSPHWLVDDRDTRPPVDVPGELVTRESFEAHRAGILAGRQTLSEVFIEHWIADALWGLEELLKKIQKFENFNLALYRVSRFLLGLEAEFLPKEEHFITYEIRPPKALEKLHVDHRIKSAGSKKKRR